MRGRAFLDSNVLVYAFTHDARAPRAEALLRSGCVLGVQTLNEFADVARRKLGFDWNEVGQALRSIRALCPAIMPLDLEVHEDGLRLGQRYRLAVYDGMIIAAALRSGCSTLWSEDLHDGLLIDGILTIKNPFAGP